MPSSVVQPPVVGQTTDATYGQLAYDAIAQTYSLSNIGGAVAVSENFGAADIIAGDPNFTTYKHIGTGDVLRLFVPGSGNTELALQYSSFASVASPNEPTKYILIGQPSASVPTTGVATYTGIVDGDAGIEAGGNTFQGRLVGLSTLSADLMNDTVKLGLTLNFSQLSSGTGVTPPGPLQLTGQGYFDRSTNATIQGHLVSAGTSIQTGKFSGNFYGPNLDEFGITFSAQTAGYPQPIDPNGRDPYYYVNGVAAGTLDSTTSSPVGQTLDQSRQAGNVLLTSDAVAVIPTGSSDTVALTPATISYDSITGQYTLIRDAESSDLAGATINNIGFFHFGPADVVSGPANFTTYQINDSYDSDPTSKNVTIGLFKTGAANSQIALTYVSYGYYNFPTYNAMSTNNYAFFLFGNKTPVGNIPTTGTATYNGIVDGVYGDTAGTYRISGASTLNADFAAQSLTTSMTFTGANVASGGPALVSQTYSGSASFVQAAPNLNGQFGGPLSSVANPGVTGQFAGSFYGPAAQEFGYSFQLFNGINGINSTIFGAGVAVGKK